MAIESVSREAAEARRKEQAKWLNRSARAMFKIQHSNEIDRIYQRIIYKMVAGSEIEEIENDDCIVFDLGYVKVIKSSCNKNQWMLKDGVSGVVWMVGGPVDTLIYQILYRYYSFYRE